MRTGTMRLKTEQLSNHKLFPLRRGGRGGLIALAICTITASAAHAQITPEDSAKLPPERTPYRVQVSMAFGRDPLLTEAFRRRVLGRITTAAARSLGQMWDLEVKENRWLTPAGVVGLERLSESPAKLRLQQTSFDKIFVLAINIAGARYTLAAREWDAMTRELGPIKTAATYQRGKVSGSAFSLVQQLFHPVLTVDSANRKTASLRLRAGAFPAIDPKAAQLREGDLIMPFYRYMNKKHIVHKIEFLPWTYLMVDKIDRGHVSCRLISGLRSPLSAGSGRRVKAMALRMRPEFDSTRLRFVPYGNRSKPLVGHHVEVIAKILRQDDAVKEKSFRLVSDRRGEIQLPFDADQPLFWLYVRSGKALLARVPYAPGIRYAETFEIPDDSSRLAVEGDVAVLKGELVDVVARRSTHLFLATSLAHKNDWQDVDLHLQQLEKLPKMKEFENQLNAIRVPAIAAAKQRKDRIGEMRIKRLCDEGVELIKRYLDEENVRVTIEVIDELRQLDAAGKGRGKRSRGRRGR